MEQTAAKILLVPVFVFCLTACGKSDSLDYSTLGSQPIVQEAEGIEETEEMKSMRVSLPVKSSGNGLENGKTFTAVNRAARVWDVIRNPVFNDYGRLIFPVDQTIDDNLTLENVDDILTWYHYINPDKTVEIVNYLGEQAEAGVPVFYDIYTEEEKAEDPWKENTGLFFFRGKQNGKVAICNAGGGFAYVGAMQDSFPHALELSKKGYNAFALIYRPGAQTACEDLARAIAFIHGHAEELQVDVTDYSLWGGSAGARLAAWLGSYGTEAFGEAAYPRPAAIIMQYTGLSEVEIDVFNGLPHGFGIGEGTVAEGWIDNAVAFWERQMQGQDRM